MSDCNSSPNAFQEEKPRTLARDQAEARLEELRQRGGFFVDAVRATRMAMVLTDPTLPGDPIIFANQSFLDLSGYAMEEVLGQQPYFMNGPGTDPEDAARFRKILADDEDGVVETVQYAKDGRRFVASVLLSAFKDEAGQTINHFLSWSDITRRVDAECEVEDLRTTQTALRESEEKYRTLFDSIDEGFCVIALMFDEEDRPVDYVFLETNPAFERQTGLVDAVGRRMRELAPQLEQHWFEIYGRIAVTGEPERFEARADALDRWFDVYAFRTGEPQQRHVAILFSDIGKRKQAEVELRESRERLGLAVDVGQLASWDWDMRSDAVTWNDRHYIIQGYAVGEVPPSFQNWLARVHPEDREEVLARIAKARDERRIYDHEFRTLHPDGTVRWCSARGRFFYDDAGAPYRMIGVMEDATERKESEAALRESEERLRRIVAGATDYAIFATDPDGVITDWMPGAAAVFGWTPEEAIGQSFEITFTPEDRASRAPARELATASDEGIAPNIRWHLRKGGDRVFIEGTTTRLVDESGTVKGFLKIGQDVTERHAWEARQKLLLEELQHRVRNILGMIRAIVRQSNEEYEDVDEYSAHLSGRLDALARTQVLLTRAEGAKVDLENLVRDELAVHVADPRQYRIEGPLVTLSPRAAEVLGLALHELATNSVKYGAMTDPRGYIEVCWSVAPIGEESWLQLVWQESCAVADTRRLRRGFGTDLIENRVPYELAGEASLDVTERGVRADITFPLADRTSVLEMGPERSIGS